VGIIANQPLHNDGALGPDECDKAVDLVVMCDSFNIPLLFFVDTPGYLGGKVAEQKKFPTKSMHLLQALALTTVPKISVTVRRAYGLAASNMCGTNASADFSIALTTADIRPVSPEMAVHTLYRSRIESAKNPETERAKVIKELQSQGGPFQAAMAGSIDDIIEPQDTRKYIINCLDVLRGQRGNFISQKLLQTWPTGF
jgi:acetyl-CoA carboxylase carboxyltransferase component